MSAFYLTAPTLVAMISSIVVGSALITWFICSSRHAQAKQRLATQLEQANRTVEELKEKETSNSEEIRELSQRASTAEATLESERKAHKEKLAELQEAEERLSTAFEHLSNKALRENRDEFLRLTEERLKTHQEGAQRHLTEHKSEIDKLVGPLAESLEKQQKQLQELEKTRQKAYGSISGLLQNMTEVQNSLRQETSKLVAALRNPRARGRWGEIQLRRVVELAGMTEYCDFTEQTSFQSEDGGRIRPDLQVLLPNERVVVIDSKVPIEAYLNAYESTDEAEQARKLKEHAAHIRGHVNEMSRRAYHEQIDGSHDFTVLFIPGEVFYYAAVNEDRELLEYAMGKGIILATPTTLLALLKAVATGWQEARLAEHAREIEKLGKELYDRIRVLAGHVTDVGSSLDRSVQSYNKLVGSLETRLLTTARRMHELEIGHDAIEEPRAIDLTTRRFSNPNLPAPGD